MNRIITFLWITFIVFHVSLAQSPDHRVLYSAIENGERKLFTMRTDGTDIQLFLPSTYEQLEFIVDASLSPDGNFLAAIVVVEYSGTFRRELRLLNVNTGEIQAITSNSIDDHGHPVWSPDGTRLAFLGKGINQGYGALYVYDLASQETALVANSRIVDSDGSTLAFGGITAIDWSPDSQRFVIALQAIDPLGGERQTDSIFIVINTDGDNAEIITPLDIEIGNPSWTQDPNMIIGACYDDGADHDNICNVDLQSGQVNKLIAINSSTTPTPPNESPFISDLILLPNSQVIFDLGSPRIYLYDQVTGTISAISNTGGSGPPVDILGWVDLPTLPEPNEAPNSNAGPDQTLTDSDDDGSELVTLDGSGSSDVDGTIESYVWTENDVEIATGVNPQVSLSVGVHTITLTVTDDDGATDTDEVVITVNPPAPSGVLDDFNRSDGAIGSNWSGDTGDYSIANNHLVAGGQDTAIIWNSTAFGANQEAIE